ncbi:MAG: hypothetical protein ABF904_12920, partial [Ethanoligenens sp.]
MGGDIPKRVLVAAVANGMIQEIFKIKVIELQKNQSELEARLETISDQSQPIDFTEEQVRGYFSAMKCHIHDRNIPEIKRMIDSYVEKVIVFADHIEVYFKVVFPDIGAVSYQFETEVGRKEVRKYWAKKRPLNLSHMQMAPELGAI